MTLLVLSYSENEVKNRWYSTVHKFVSVGSKRKERDFAYEIENSPQDFEANSNFEHLHKTRFTEIEKEIYSFIQGVVWYFSTFLPYFDNLEITNRCTLVPS